MSSIFRLLLFAALTAVLASACTNSDSRQLAEQSSAEVMIPVASKFRDTWHFHIEDSPNNYTFGSNASASYDPDVDPSLMVMGYQVNDTSIWSGGDITGIGQKEKDALISAITDSAELSPSGPCTDRDASLQLVSCVYDVESPDGPLPVLVRRFDSASTIMIALYANDVAADYLSGEFESVAIQKATAEWLNDN